MSSYVKIIVFWKERCLGQWYFFQLHLTVEFLCFSYVKNYGFLEWKICRSVVFPPFLSYVSFQVSTLETHKSKLEEELKTSNSSLTESSSKLTELTLSLKQKEEQLQTVSVSTVYHSSKQNTLQALKKLARVNCLPFTLKVHVHCP